MLGDPPQAADRRPTWSTVLTVPIAARIPTPRIPVLGGATLLIGMALHLRYGLASAHRWTR
jgi:hypothetical protein